MKSGESHCNHELASDVGRGGGKRMKKKKKDVLIKSNNPHLAGGEKHTAIYTRTVGQLPIQAYLDFE